jgi:SAM-dependent methyltransferase
MNPHQQAVQEFHGETREFNRCAERAGLGDLSPYLWYHTVELPPDLVTPGLFDFRASLPSFHFPPDMRGLTVLDVGSATGFFAFELEKRGAKVFCVELPSLEALDRFPGQSVEQTVEKIKGMVALESTGEFGQRIRNYTAGELYHYLLEAPFELCRKLLHSQVERHFCTVYELSPRRLGIPAFDWVLMGDILLHTINPLGALASAASLCRGVLVLSQDMPEAPDGEPAMHYLGGEDPVEDQVSWWLPNRICLVQLLKKLGFRDVVEVGHHSGIQRPFGYEYNRTVVHARK